MAKVRSRTTLGYDARAGRFDSAPRVPIFPFSLIVLLKTFI